MAKNGGRSCSLAVSLAWAPMASPVSYPRPARPSSPWDKSMGRLPRRVPARARCVLALPGPFRSQISAFSASLQAYGMMHERSLYSSGSRTCLQDVMNFAFCEVPSLVVAPCVNDPAHPERSLLTGATLIPAGKNRIANPTYLLCYNGIHPPGWVRPAGDGERVCDPVASRACPSLSELTLAASCSVAGARRGRTLRA